MWAQEWGNIYDIVAPKGAGDLGFDTGELLKEKGYDPVKMVKTGEGFYSSLGFEPLPETFWTRSQIAKPADREVICHASAWDVDNKDDLRIKMCTKVNGDDFVTIHHELGHNYYQRAYNKQPFLYLNGANDGFHEAIGDFVALSITPDYLVQIGLLDQAKVPSADKDIGLLLRTGDGQGGVPAVRPADRQMALGRILGIDQAGRLRGGRGTRCGCNIRALRRRSRATRPSSIPARNIMCRRACPIPAISWRGCCSSSSTRRRATRPAGRTARTAVPSTGTRKWARN